MHLFPSFFGAGFECSTLRLRERPRLDLLATTGHDRFLRQDYTRLLEYGMRTVREGIRWHLIEPFPGRYDFSSAIKVMRASEEMGIQIIWDLMHFGYPDDIDVFSTQFVERYANYAGEFARVVSNESNMPIFVTPINEISFFASHGGQVGFMYPFGINCGAELKAQLVLATIHGLEAIRDIVPARSVITEPIFNAVPGSADPDASQQARAYSDARYEAWDMLEGRLHPELGGAPKYLDIVGVNYYPWNQWVYIGEGDAGPRLARDDPRYISLTALLQAVYDRYQRPMLISETSAEDEARADWLAYVGAQTRAAMQQGVPLEGICLYPIVNFHAWEDGRAAQNGLWGYPDNQGNREIYEPMARELQNQQRRMEYHPPMEYSRELTRA